MEMCISLESFSLSCLVSDSKLEIKNVLSIPMENTTAKTAIFFGQVISSHSSGKQ